jgi:flagellar biosynthetic protein FlhB
MAEDSAQEKTEEPSPKKLEEARKKGDVPRSKEMGVVALLFGAYIGAIFWGGMVADDMQSIMKFALVLDRADISDPSKMIQRLAVMVREGFLSISLIMIFISLIVIITTLAVGGWNYSNSAFAPKFNKLNPFSGIKRMFSTQTLVELIKSVGKFLCVVIASIWVIDDMKVNIKSLSSGGMLHNINESIEILLWAFLIMSSTMILIVIIDVPFQKHSYIKKLKMTMQELKDEMKNVEGKPEVKQRIKQVQQQISQNRMMNDVPDADVIIVNPEHYSIALKYDSDKSEVPFVVAKGLDDVAMRIREIAKENNVPIVSAPPLARSIYKFTDINQKIPMGLYSAVAQILAYVYQLRSYQDNPSDFDSPEKINSSQLEIPEELKYD